MAAPFASLQQLNARRESRHSRNRSSPGPQLAPSYAYHDFYDRPTPRSFNSFNSYAIPAPSGSGSAESWQPPVPYQSASPPTYPGPEHAHLFQPLPMPVPPQYSAYRPPPPDPQVGQGHAAPAPYYTYLHPSASQAWSDPSLRDFAAGLDQRAAPITRDRPSEYDLSRRPVWDAPYQPFLTSQEPPRRDHHHREEVFLPYGDFSPQSGTWRAPSSSEHRRSRSHSHSHSSAASYPYQFYAYPVAAMAPYPAAAYHASQYPFYPPMEKPKEKRPRSSHKEKENYRPIIISPPMGQQPFIPSSNSHSHSHSHSSSPSPSPPRRKCFLTRLFSNGSDKKPGMAKLPEPKPKDVLFDSSPSSTSSGSSTLANFGSQGGLAGSGRKEVRWGEIKHW
ncbi:unnamed protein product [Peniophora sp. CBMAI 1063]|nr:unnamed protein product [Peniophora sp. CBMAI 1063]